MALRCVCDSGCTLFILTQAGLRDLAFEVIIKFSSLKSTDSGRRERGSNIVFDDSFILFNF